MATYSSQAVAIQASAENVFSKLSDLSNLRTLLDNATVDKIPEDKRDLFNNINVSEDSITVPAGPVGDLIFRVVERKAPSFVKLDAENSPLPLNLALSINPQSAESCTAKVDINIDLPIMLKGMVGGQIQRLADQFGQVLKSIPFA